LKSPVAGVGTVRRPWERGLWGRRLRKHGVGEEGRGESVSAAPGWHKSYSALWPRRRRKIKKPNATTRPAQTIRTTEESMNSCSFLAYLSADYMFSIMGMRSRTSRVSTGPTVTTNSDGSTQKKIGKTSLTANLEARSSAR
jgi:hypothetical protein